MSHNQRANQCSIGVSHKSRSNTSYIGIYPGTFDPITYGHSDIIQRATKLVDSLIIAVAESHDKPTLFTLDERVKMVQEEVEEIRQKSGPHTITVQDFDMLLMDFAMHLGARVIIRGLRAVGDFEYEFQMAWMNSRMNAQIETIFLMASEGHQFVSSRLVKEISHLNGDVMPFVSSRVADRLRRHFSSTCQEE